MKDSDISARVDLLIEKKIREVDLPGGERAPIGSRAHITAIQRCIDDLEWSNNHKKGSQAHLDYTRAMKLLRAKLKKAKLYAAQAAEKNPNFLPPLEELDNVGRRSR